ncbi:hypothetical protein R1flu_025481 [Riccia fluitans]|uniref:Uncharacterized protein n=1 Tax=Riccia fluitans TaxID=41844 RepID=A0ABD1XXW9_9MARC
MPSGAEITGGGREKSQSESEALCAPPRGAIRGGNHWSVAPTAYDNSDNLFHVNVEPDPDFRTSLLKGDRHSAMQTESMSHSRSTCKSNVHSETAKVGLVGRGSRRRCPSFLRLMIGSSASPIPHLGAKRSSVAWLLLRCDGRPFRQFTNLLRSEAKWNLVQRGSIAMGVASNVSNSMPRKASTDS